MKQWLHDYKVPILNVTSALFVLLVFVGIAFGSWALTLAMLPIAAALRVEFYRTAALRRKQEEEAT